MAAVADDAVWVDVLPNMSKFGPAVGAGASSAAAPAGAAGMATGRAFGLAMVAGVAVVAGAAVLAGKALYDIGATFDEMTDTIRVGTGASGDALDGLVDSAKNMSTKIPASFEDIGTTVADVNTRLGLTGPTLEKFSSQFLEAGRITGEALDMNTITASFSVFKVEGEDTTAAMDTLFRVSQDTGIGMNDLAANVQKAGPAIQNLGFDFDQTAAMVGAMDKAGLDAGRMTAGLAKSLTTLAKDGEEPAAAFERVTGEIKSMADAGDIAGATTKSAELFGTKNAPAFMQALQDGTMNLDELSAAAEGSGDTILGVADETADFDESWVMFKNTLMLAVEPIATRVFQGISNAMKWIMDVGVPAVQGFGRAWSEGTGPMGAVRSVLGNVKDFIVKSVVPAVMNIVTIIKNNVVPMALAWFGVFKNSVLPVLRDVAAFVVTQLIPTVSKILSVLGPIVKLFGAVIQTVFMVIIVPAMKAVWWVIKNVLGPIFNWLWTTIIDPVITKVVGAITKFSDAAVPIFEKVRSFIADKVGPAFKTFGDGVASVFEGIKAATAKPINFVINTIYNDGIRKALNLIPGVNLDKATPIPGYRLGGYTGNIHPDEIAGVTHGREYVLTEQETAGMGGPSGVESWKRLALGRGYKRGGPVKPVISGTSGNTYGGHTGLDFPAGRGAPVRATAAGTILRTPRLRTSYGNHIVQSIAGTALKALYAHLSSIGVRPGQTVGAGQVIGGVGNTGRSFGNHLHFEVGSALGRTSTVGSTRAWLRGSSGIAGGIVPGALAGATESSVDSGLLSLVTTLPKTILGLVEKAKEGLTGPWGSLMRGGIVDILGDVKDWMMKKLNPFAADTRGVVADPEGKTGIDKLKAKRGYAGGTGWALPGVADLGEYGAELVVGPQSRLMAGGEKVMSASASRAFGASGDLRAVSGTFTIDEDGNAHFRGLAQEVYDDNTYSASRWDRMGAR